MLNFLNICSKSRKYWILLVFSIIILECIALYLQHSLLLDPCILCIYQRCALYGIAIAGLIAIISPSYIFIRLFAILIWIYSAGKGLSLSKEQTDMQLHPSPFAKCDLFVKFPNWLPLNQWWPAMFDAYGDCTAQTWYLLSLEISQWMWIIFINYLILALLTCFAQFINFKKSH